MRELGSVISWEARGGGSTESRSTATASTRTVVPTRVPAGSRPRPPDIDLQEHANATTVAASHTATQRRNPPDTA